MDELRARYSAPDWPVLRRRVFERDGYRCVTCGARKALLAHHLTYQRLGHELLSDLATQCVKCHAKGAYGWAKINADRKALFWISAAKRLTNWLLLILKLALKAIKLLAWMFALILIYAVALVPTSFMLLTVVVFKLPGMLYRLPMHAFLRLVRWMTDKLE